MKLLIAWARYTRRFVRRNGIATRVVAGLAAVHKQRKELIPLVWSAEGRYRNSPEFKNGT
jgi:hypothetical protein